MLCASFSNDNDDVRFALPREQTKRFVDTEKTPFQRANAKPFETELWLCGAQHNDRHTFPYPTKRR